MKLSLFLFLIGMIGFILNRKNLLLLIISIEIMLLAVKFTLISLVFFLLAHLSFYLYYFSLVALNWSSLFFLLITPVLNFEHSILDILISAGDCSLV